jgi:DMSO reductase anchor subunit
MELQWPLIVFTLLTCLAAGTFGVQGLLSYMGRGERLQMPALITSLAAIIIGGIASFLHLQHWERIFNGFGHITSGITQELIAIALFVVGLAIYFVMYRRSEDGRLPKWCGAMAMVLGVLLVVVMSRSYAMAARPAWDTPLLTLYYLSNALLFGGSAVLLISAATRARDLTAARVAVVGGIAQVVLTAAYAGYLVHVGNSMSGGGYYIDPTEPLARIVQPSTVLGGAIIGGDSMLFWLGVVAVGLAVPAALAVLENKNKGTRSSALYVGAGLVAAMVGAVCFRAILYTVGVGPLMY